MPGDADRGWGLGHEIPLHSFLAPPHAEVPRICSAEASFRKKKKKSPGGRKGIVTQPKFEMQVPGVLEKKIGVCKLKKKQQTNPNKNKTRTPNLWELVL